MAGLGTGNMGSAGSEMDSSTESFLLVWNSLAFMSSSRNTLAGCTTHRALRITRSEKKIL